MHPRPSPPVRRRTLALALAAALAAGAAGAEPAKVLKATELRATPAPNADVVANLKADDVVEIAARQGAWANVNAGGVAGWARVMNLRSASGGSSGNGRADFGALFATGSTGATSTTGAKGLTGNDLMNASADFAELGELDGFAATVPDAQSFAGQAPVQAQQVPYLPEGNNGRGRR